MNSLVFFRNWFHLKLGIAIMLLRNLEPPKFSNRTCFAIKWHFPNLKTTFLNAIVEKRRLTHWAYFTYQWDSNVPGSPKSTTTICEDCCLQSDFSIVSPWPFMFLAIGLDTRSCILSQREKQQHCNRKHCQCMQYLFCLGYQNNVSVTVTCSCINTENDLS